MPTTDPLVGAASVLAHLARPYEPVKVVSVLLGLPQRLARQVIGHAVATSDEAQELLHAMPQIVRSLAVATTDRPERCFGEVRGPVLWSETMSARSASAGDPGLYVCATTTKAYDTDENRILKAALAAVHRAARDADYGREHDEDHAHVRHTGQTAWRLMEHQTLSAVPVVRPNGRMLRRTRAGSRRATYQPALAVLRRASDPITPAQLLAHADAPTAEQITLLGDLLDHFDTTIGMGPALHVERGTLVSGSLSYGHLEGIAVAGVHVLSAADFERARQAATGQG